jgi:hypothetical protein
MGSGGGGSTTEIKPEKPILVNTYTPRSVLYGATELAQNRNENLGRTTASYNAALDSLLGRPSTSTKDELGNVIEPYQVSKVPDYSVLYDPEKNPYLAEELELASRRRKNKNKNKDKDEERENYLNALNFTNEQAARAHANN